jgi:hypothetical protein
VYEVASRSGIVTSSPEAAGEIRLRNIIHS